MIQTTNTVSDEQNQNSSKPPKLLIATSAS